MTDGLNDGDEHDERIEPVPVRFEIPSTTLCHEKHGHFDGVNGREHDGQVKVYVGYGLAHICGLEEKLERVRGDDEQHEVVKLLVLACAVHDFPRASPERGAGWWGHVPPRVVILLCRAHNGLLPATLRRRHKRQLVVDGHFVEVVNQRCDEQVEPEKVSKRHGDDKVKCRVLICISL